MVTTPHANHDRRPARAIGGYLLGGLLLAALAAVLQYPRFVTAAPVDAQADPGEQMARAQATTVRIERDRTGRCIPAAPHLASVCSDEEAALWADADGALTARLAAGLGRQPSAGDVAVALIEGRARAGDLAALAALAAAHGGPELRVVAVGLSADPTAEYLEIENLGATAASLAAVLRPNRDAPADLVLRVIPAAPGGVGFFFLDEAVLAPGGRCRLYSLAAGQPDACPGIWLRPSAGPRWPEPAGWALLYGSPPCRLTGPGRVDCDTTVYEIDRWLYRP